MAIACFLLGFAASFYWGWELTLILLGSFPVLGAIGIGFGLMVESSQTHIMKSYAQSAGYAEQALQSMKVVQTFGNEELENNNYMKYLSRSRSV